MLKRLILCKRGSQMVEATIVFPITILAAVLLVRLFVFYMNIIDTSICEHIGTLRKNDGYSGKTSFRTYKDSADIVMLRGGLLKFDLSKHLEIKEYLINEDTAVRLGEKLKDLNN